MGETGQSDAPAFSGPAEAVTAVSAGLAFLAATDPATLPVETLAGCLRELGRAESVHAAVRSRFLSVFHAQDGPAADGHPTTKSWLRGQTGVTGAAAGGQVGWMRRLAVHAQIARALAGATISLSWARELCDWTDRLPPEVRDTADQILLDAAAGGAGLPELSRIAEQLYERTAPPEPDDGNGPDGGDDGFTDRRVWLDRHYQGAGKLAGDLTPECATALTAVLDALGKKAGPEDDRTQAQRHHDALEEACRRLLGTGDLPDVAGQPAQALVHVTLDQLRGLPGAAAAEAAWMSGRAAQGYACDARLTPVITGYVDPAALEALARDILAAARGEARTAARPAAQPPTLSRLQDTLLRWALDLLSGPAGLAAVLRAGTSGPHAAGVSLPLDTGAATATVPPHLRRLVILRDRHCAFPGCDRRPARCQVHHVIPRSQGGATALPNLTLLCDFHHLIAIHRWGWDFVLNGDGTTTATSPDGSRVFRSHSPPAAAAA